MFVAHALLLDALRAQPLGARALEKTQITGMIDHAAGVGVFPVDADGPGEDGNGSRGVERIGDARRTRGSCFARFPFAVPAPGSSNKSSTTAPLRRLQPQMPIRLARDHAAARGAHQEALLDQERFEHVFDRAALFGQRRGERFHADRAAVEMIDDRAEQAPIERVEAFGVDLEHLQRRDRDRRA